VYFYREMVALLLQDGKSRNYLTQKILANTLKQQDFQATWL